MAENVIRSMTGFGRAQGDTPWGRATVEIRSLNHRFLEVQVKAPREALHLEPAIRKAVKERAARGKVEVFITLERLQPRFEVDLPAAREAVRVLRELALVVDDRVGLDDLLSLGELVRPAGGAQEGISDEALLEVVHRALEDLGGRREEEGGHLLFDLVARGRSMSELRERMLPLAGEAPERVRRQVVEFVAGAGVAVDPGRLEAEVALLSQKADVTEELTRLEAHLKALTAALEGGGAVGRRIDFLLQEIQREVNTIGSKCQDPAMSALVVEFKTELEKVREQVQNIE